jgi:hypothetical protein
VISDLVADTVAVAVSAACNRNEAEAAMQIAAPVGRMLIAGGHMDRMPLVLIAGSVHCEITTISGTAALRTEENLNVVPGAATAETFTVYLPAPKVLATVVAEAAAGHPRLSAGTPPKPDQTMVKAATLVDLDALRKAVTGR